MTDPSAPSDAPALPPRRPWLAALLSLLRPGLGHAYCGRLKAGLWVALLNVLAPTVVALAWAIRPFGVRAFVAAVVVSAIVPWVGGVVNAWGAAKTASPTPRRYQSALGYVLFAFGTYFGSQLVAGGVREKALEAFSVPSASMAPTLLEGDWVLVRKLGESRGPQRGAIGVFYVAESPEAQMMQPHVKRVVALAGDLVEIAGGRVLVNGRDVGPAGITTADKLTVPEGQFFALADTPEKGADSRSYGPVPDSQYVGRVEGVYFSVGGGRVRWERIGLAPR